MVDFSIANGNSVAFVDTTPEDGFIIDFDTLDNSFNLQINGVDLFVGGPAGAPNELQFQIPGTAGQTVRFADGDRYEINTPAVWQLGNTNGEPVVRLIVNSDGTIELYGVKVANGPLEPLELFNGLTVNTDAIAAAWNDAGTNSVVLDQSITGPTNAAGEFDDVPCFARGTLIETRDGPKRVEDLEIGDSVLTYDNGHKPIRWIGSCYIGPEQLFARPRLKPILIRADALGAGYPREDLVVSPQHRILVSSAIARRMFDCDDVLVPAKKLLSLTGVETVDTSSEGVEYFHILFDQHEVIWSNGTPTESLFLGPEALKSVSFEARQEITQLFPECACPDFYPLSARHIPKHGKRVLKLVQRHQMNQQPLFNGSAVHEVSPGV